MLNEVKRGRVDYFSPLAIESKLFVLLVTADQPHDSGRRPQWPGAYFERDQRWRKYSGSQHRRIKVPVLVVHNESGECKLTPYAEVPNIMAKLTGSAKVELISFKGGSGMKGDPCESISYRGFIGKDRALSNWIKSQSK